MPAAGSPDRSPVHSSHRETALAAAGAQKRALRLRLDCFASLERKPVEAPLALPLSPRGERTLEHPLRAIRASLLPSGEKDRMRGHSLGYSAVIARPRERPWRSRRATPLPLRLPALDCFAPLAMTWRGRYQSRQPAFKRNVPSGSCQLCRQVRRHRPAQRPLHCELKGNCR